MKPNLVDRTCELLKWVCNYRKLQILLWQNSSSIIPTNLSMKKYVFILLIILPAFSKLQFSIFHDNITKNNVQTGTHSDDRRLSIVCWPTTTVYILCTVTSEHEQLMTSVCLERQLSPTLALARLTAATTHTMTVYFNTRQCKLYTLVLYTLSQTSSIILARS